MRFGSGLALALLLALPPSSALAQTVIPRGTTIWDPASAQNGLTLVPTPASVVQLIAMDGTVVNEWTSPDPNLLLGGQVEPLDGGHIIALAGETVIPGEGPRYPTVMELDFDGNLVWRFDRPSRRWQFHHDMERLANGNTLILCSFDVLVPAISPKTLRDDCVVELDPDNHPVWAWLTSDHFDAFGFNDVEKALISESGGDWAHANAMSSLPANSHTDPALREGNILINYRELNTAIIVDKDTKEIVWKLGPDPSPFIGAHHVHMIPEGLEGAGNIIAFDNGFGGGYPRQARDFSRVLEIDPVAKQVVRSYAAENSGLHNTSFFSSFISGVQRLPNGNTLITEGVKGRLFEIAFTGGTHADIVWEYMNPVSAMRPSAAGAIEVFQVYRSFRLPLDWAPAQP